MERQLVHARVGVLVETLLTGISEGGILLVTPGRIDGLQGAIDGVTELVHRDAFIVIAIEREAEQILLPEGSWPPSRAAPTMRAPQRMSRTVRSSSAGFG